MHIETSTHKVSTDETVPSTIITPEQLYDPLLVLFNKLHLNYWWALTGMGILSATGLYGWLLLGTLTPLQVLFGAIVVPLWMGIYLFLPSLMANLFDRLWRNEVIGEYRAAGGSGSMSYEWFVTKQARWIHSRWWVGVALFLLTMYWLYRFFFVPNDPLKHAPLWLLFIVIFVFSLVGYVGFLSIVWLLRIVVFTNRLFQNFAIRVRPLHPDGSGGLGLFNFFLWISVTLVMIGVCSAISLGLHGFNVTYLLAAIACYLIILPSLLTTWLAWLHLVMVQFRNELLLPLSDEYERAVIETMPSAAGDTAAIIAGTERLAALQKRYEQVRNSYPTWPIELVQLRRLAIVLILPLLLALLPSLLDVLTKK
jgi:hypothetical protein